MNRRNPQSRCAQAGDATVAAGDERHSPATIGRCYNPAVAAALAALAWALAAGGAPAPLKPAQMRFADAGAARGEPRLVPVHMHAPPAIAMPAENAAQEDLLGPVGGMGRRPAPFEFEPIAAAPEAPGRPAGWLSRDRKEARDAAAVARPPGRTAGWLAQGVYRIRDREDSLAIRDASDPSSLDLDLDLDLDALDSDRAHAWFGAGKARRESDWSANARDRWTSSEAAPFSRYGVQGGDLAMPGDAMPLPREQNFALPAYGNADDGW